jgi:hypothetical protein
MFMGKVYRPYYPDEELLLPPSLRDWLPGKHLAYFVSDVVDNLDLSSMDAVYTPDPMRTGTCGPSLSPGNGARCG